MPKTASKKSSKKAGSKKEKTSKKAKKPKKPLKPYCGIQTPLPKTKRLGSMEECLNMNKVNYYGVKKIDSRLLDIKAKEKELVTTLKNAQNEMASSLGKETKLKKLLAIAKTVEDEEKFKKELNEIRIKKSKLQQKIDELKKKTKK